MFIAAADWSCSWLFWKGERPSDTSTFLKAGRNRDGQNNNLVAFETVTGFPLHTLEVLIFVWGVAISMFIDTFFRSLWLH